MKKKLIRKKISKKKNRKNYKKNFSKKNNNKNKNQNPKIKFGTPPQSNPSYLNLKKNSLARGKIQSN